MSGEATSIGAHGIANANSLAGALMVEELVRCGADMFFLSPGARCAPLAFAVAGNPRARSVVHFDERGAAFHALGHARATGRPSVLVCTSGTAGANYLPAVIEAHMSCVPLIVLTADRPPEMIDTGANQTIEQGRMFGEYVRWRGSLPCPDGSLPPESILTLIDQAVYRAVRGPAGPVHVNCPFREPLAPVRSGEDLSRHIERIRSWNAGDTPYTAYAASAPAVDPALIAAVAAQTRAAGRGLILAGRLDGGAERAAVAALAHRLDWPLFADVTSGLRLGGVDAPVVHYADLLLQSGFDGGEPPDMVIQAGTPFVSKRFARLIEDRPPRDLVLVAPHPFRTDPVHQVTLRIEADIATFCEALVERVEPQTDTTWKKKWTMASEQAGRIVEQILGAEAVLNEPAVARTVCRGLPAEHTLFLGNSMPIRDFDTFGPAKGPGPRVIANRGASGIDGNIATAAGLARALNGTVTAVIGDLAALHDLDSLALLRDVRLALVIINNDGGGIFSFLPLAQFPEYFERHFATPHGFSFGQAAAMFGIRYNRPGTLGEFEAAFGEAQTVPDSTIIEVWTNRAANATLHDRLREAAAKVR